MATARRILVSTDFSAGTKRTLAYACELAARLGAELHLLHVAPVHNFPLPIGSESDGRLRDARIRRGRLSLLASLNRLGVVCEPRTGRPAEEVVRYAREKQVGLIAMSNHGRTGLTHALMGSMTEQVIRTAGEPAEAMLSGATEVDLCKVLRSSGTPSLVGDGLRKVKEGITTPEEVQGMRSI
jgi:universal stress protein A